MSLFEIPGITILRSFLSRADQEKFVELCREVVRESPHPQCGTETNTGSNLLPVENTDGFPIIKVTDI